MKVRRYIPAEEEELWRLYHDTTHSLSGKVYTIEQDESWTSRK